MQVVVPGVIFPPISYCLLLQQNNTTIDGWAYYHKQSIRNHFSILSANGRLTLTIPITSIKGKLVPLNDICIESGTWHRPLLTALQSAYGKSPFYFYFKDEIESMMSSMPGSNLYETQIHVLKWLRKYLGFPELQETEQWEISTPELDFRKLKKKWELNTPIQSYHQVFMDRFQFESDLSILDLLFNLGPQAKNYLREHPILSIPQA
ncbi:MAG: hypothetical protein RL062_191 [Bacteroidota bacterium]